MPEKRLEKKLKTLCNGQHEETVSAKQVGFRRYQSPTIMLLSLEGVVLVTLVEVIDGV